VNREERLRRELPDELKPRAGELADLPTAQVDLIINALRASRREGRAIETQMRRRRREGRGGPSAAAVSRLASGAARHPSLETLAALAEHYANGHAVLQLVVDGLRAVSPEPFSWTEIGAALGITRQAAWDRFARQADLDTAQASIRVVR
jgi:hypothetical protein